MNLNGQNELSLEYNVYAKVFIPAGLDFICNKKYINNAGYVVNCSPVTACVITTLAILY